MGLRERAILIADGTEITDKTDQIENIQKNGNVYRIKFARNSKTYSYGQERILELTLKREIDLKGLQVFANGTPLSDVKSLGDYGSYYGVEYTGRRHVEFILSCNIKIKRDEKSVLDYLAAVAEKAVAEKKEPLDTEDEQTNKVELSFLAKQIKKIEVDPQTILAKYITGQPVSGGEDVETKIYPFPINLSQKEAISKALTYKISIIQGPPGTGKTQSILNLIANLIYRGKTVGVVSNNNSAIENVKEKLEKSGYGFLIAHLGNNQNRKLFFEQNDHDFNPDKEWKLEVNEKKEYLSRLESTNKNIDRLLRCQEELARVRELLSSTELEYSHFELEFSKIELPSLYAVLLKWHWQKLAHFKIAAINFPEKLRLKFILKYLTLRCKYGKPFTAFRCDPDHEICLAIDYLIYTKKMEDLRSRIITLEEELAINSIQELLKTSTQISDLLFKDLLYNKYHGKDFTVFTDRSYSRQFEEFTDRYPVILSTTHSILNSVSEPLDYVIIDESSQVDIITASLAFSLCRNVVIVGDTRQLSHIVPDELRTVSDEKIREYGIGEEYDYSKNNIIRSLELIYGQNLPQTLLREHYRCNPRNIGFCNRKFYRDELVMMRNEPQVGYPLGEEPLTIYRTAPGNHQRGRMNERQLYVIKEEVLEDCSCAAEEIGIITPYRDQANALTEIICGDSGMIADTIHKFQGKEKNVIIFSTVANEINPFIDSAELINVAVSRAKERFVLVMPHHYELTHGSNIGDLIRYIKYCYPDAVIDSKIVSHFDILYNDYSKILYEFRTQVYGKEGFLSENIIYRLLVDIIEEYPEFSGLKVNRHYPLFMLIRDTEGFTEREKSFCHHPRAHVDFLITNRCDNSIVLAIEVDGYAFHSDEKQQERDSIKNMALSKNNIDLLRLRTTSDREKEIITEKLHSLM